MSRLAIKGIQAAAGAAAAGGGAVYVDDVFSTYLYEGTGNYQFVNNGIDLGAYPFAKIASTNGYSVSGSETFTVNVKADTKLVVFALDSSGSVLSCTLDGAGLTAKTSSTSWYGVAVFIETLTAGTHTIVVGDNNVGHTEVMLFDPNATVSVETNLAVSAQNATSVTTSAVTTDGFCIFLGSDRDPGANFSCNQTSTEYYEVTHTYFNFGAIAINGSSGTVPAATISGMVGTYATNWCLLKVEGIGNAPTANSAASGEGGLVWTKNRDNTYDHNFVDSARGLTNSPYIRSNTTGAQGTDGGGITAFNSNGYTVGSSGSWNANGNSHVSWTFRKQPGFFDIVTYSGNGNGSTAISHNLGSVPGMMIIKRTNTSGDWAVYHRGIASNPVGWKLKLNDASTRNYSTSYFPTLPTDSVFYPGSDADVNGSGHTYVAYLFAHDAQDFGTDSNEAIIKCGSFTTDGAGKADVDLGFEPQWMLTKYSEGSQDWFVYDNMREWGASGAKYLSPNTTGAESSGAVTWPVNSTGFKIDPGVAPNRKYIYVAIRRPHKPAEEFAATNLFKTVTGRSDSVSPSYETGFVTDMGIQRRPATTESNLIFSRLTGPKYYDTDNNSDAEATGSNIVWDYMNGALSYFNSTAYRFWGWRRAPGFFDAVAYTGTGSARTISHNLGAVPEMIWVVNRSYGERKAVYTKETGNQKWLDLTYTYTGNADSAGAYWNSTTPTESVFSLGNQGRVNGNNYNYVAFLFATVAGISKIGSYTGTGSSDINIDCGFSNGARFVLIKCIGGNSAGNHWYLFDSERGIATGNDPYIVLDDTSTSAYGAQDAIDPLSSGFKVRSTAVDGINANGGTYLFYAIA